MDSPIKIDENRKIVLTWKLFFAIVFTTVTVTASILSAVNIWNNAAKDLNSFIKSYEQDKKLLEEHIEFELSLLKKDIEANREKTDYVNNRIDRKFDHLKNEFHTE